MMAVVQGYRCDICQRECDKGITFLKDDILPELTIDENGEGFHLCIMCCNSINVLMNSTRGILPDWEEK
jgi:hypothetical protein